MSVISWGRREKVTFSSVGNLHEWTPPATSCLFAVTYQRDPNNKPKGHTVFYFGEADNPSQNAGAIRKRVTEAWFREGGRPEDLFVFVHTMEGSTAVERSRILESLVMEYQPQANKQTVE